MIINFIALGGVINRFSDVLPLANAVPVLEAHLVSVKLENFAVKQAVLTDSLHVPGYLLVLHDLATLVEAEYVHALHNVADPLSEELGRGARLEQCLRGQEPHDGCDG